MGVSDAPVMPPMLFFSKNKNYLSNQMHSFSKNKNNTGASDTTHPSSTTHNIPHQHTTHPPPTHGEKVGP